MGRSEYTGFSKDDRPLRHLAMLLLKNYTGAEKAVSRISTFFFLRNSFAPQAFGGIEGKGVLK